METCHKITFLRPMDTLCRFFSAILQRQDLFAFLDTEPFQRKKKWRNLQMYSFPINHTSYVALFWFWQNSVQIHVYGTNKANVKKKNN